jgi:hypothetical protein
VLARVGEFHIQGEEGMVCKRLGLVLLTGTVLAAAGAPARADDCAPPAPAPCAPATQKVTVREWVPETYQCNRTVYTTECRQEVYTAYRTECTAETRTRTCTVYRMVPETHTVMQNICVTVPVVEERTTWQTHVTCRPVTKIVKKCEDHGHYECREVPCGPTLHERLKKCFHHHDCCECEPCCVRTKTVKVWVPCKVWVDVPVTSYERVCEQRPVVCKVTVCKTEIRQQPVQVTTCKCVPEARTETYTVMVPRQIAYKATRTVAVCVPRTEVVTATRMVCRLVEKEVPVTTCCSPCAPAECAPCCCKKHHFGHH